MRLTSSLWVGAYIRRCNAQGAMAVVSRHGADEAGAIFVIIDRLDGTSDLYAPAPQTAFEDAMPSDRLFQKVIERGSGEAISERIGRETRFDPDLWVVAVEDRDGRDFLEIG
jgi:hypothetical protein